jgi:hypothetical protein
MDAADTGVCMRRVPVVQVGVLESAAAIPAPHQESGQVNRMANSTKRGLLGLTEAQGVTMFWVGVALMIVAFLLSLWKSL